MRRKTDTIYCQERKRKREGDEGEKEREEERGEKEGRREEKKRKKERKYLVLNKSRKMLGGSKNF